MGPHLRVSILLVCLGAVAVPVAQAGTGQEGQAETPQSILEQMQTRLAAVSNYQCTQLTRMGERCLAYDRLGRARVRETHDNLDATTCIWDGTRTIQTDEHLRSDGTVLYSASVLPSKDRQLALARVPWDYLGTSVFTRLAQAMANGKGFSITPTEDGYCRLELRDSHMIRIVVLDPERGYLPIRQEMIARGRCIRRERIEFSEVSPGVWFPARVWQHNPPLPESSNPASRFTDIRINDPDFERLLTPDLPDGSTVADEIRGVRYVVDHQRGLTLGGSTAARRHAVQAIPVNESSHNTSQESVATNYQLDAYEAIKHTGPPYPSARASLVCDGDAPPEEFPGPALDNTVLVLQWDGGPKPKVTYIGTGFLTLAEVLQYVCELNIGEYSGPEDLLNLRLKGDWIVRRDTLWETRLRTLERIVYEETDTRIVFEKRRVDSPVVRATGIFQYHPLNGASHDNDIQLCREAGADTHRTHEGNGSGRLGQMLRHLGQRIHRRIVDETLSSDVEVSWSDYASSDLTHETKLGADYRLDLAQVLDTVARQTGLTFTHERRKIDEWFVTVKP